MIINNEAKSIQKFMKEKFNKKVGFVYNGDNDLIMWELR